MLSLQLCLSIAPLLAGSEARPEAIPSLVSAVPYHLIAQADGHLTLTPVVFNAEEDDDDDDDDRDDDDRREGRGDRREGGEDRRPEHGRDDRKPEGRDEEGHRPQLHRPDGRPENHRPEMHRPEGRPGRDQKPGEHQPPRGPQGPLDKKPGDQPAPQHGPHGPQQHGPQGHGEVHPPVPGQGMPDFSNAFGPGSPFARAFGGGSPFGVGSPFAGRSSVMARIHQPAGHGPGNSVLSGIIFELLDQNHDGNLSRGEFQKLADAVEKAHHPQMGPAAGAGPQIGPGPHIGPGPGNARSQLSRRNGPPMIHQPRPLLQAHKPDGDKKPGEHRPAGEPDRKPESVKKDDHREHGDREHGDRDGKREGDHRRPDGDHGKKPSDRDEPRI